VSLLRRPVAVGNRPGKLASRNIFAGELLERFPAKRISVRAKKARQTKNLEPAPIPSELKGLLAPLPADRLFDTQPPISSDIAGALRDGGVFRRGPFHGGRSESPTWTSGQRAIGKDFRYLVRALSTGSD